MTYKEFSDWCNERACDGMWSFDTATTCILVIECMQKTPFFLRKRRWNEIEERVMRTLVNPTNEKIKEVIEKMEDTNAE